MPIRRIPSRLVPLFVLPALFAAVTLFAASGDAEKAQPGQHGREMRRKVEVELKIDYLLFLPEGYGKHEGESGEKQKWPVIMFLHGAGERGDDLEKVKAHGPPKIVETRQDFPFVVVSPQCPDGQWWDPQTLVALLDEVVANYDVDPDRVYLTGLSLGGFGTFATAIEYPDRFAAIAPICGGGNRFQAAKLKDLPTWVFHGEDDEAVPIERSEEMVKAMERAGAKEVKFTRYPGVGHDSWTQTYDNQELYDWFLEHSRAQDGGAEAESQPKAESEPKADKN